MDSVTGLSPCGEKASRGSRRNLRCISAAFGGEELPARLRVPGKLSVSSCGDDGWEGRGSRLLWACHKENSQNIQAFSQAKVLAWESPAAEEAEQGGLAGWR